MLIFYKNIIFNGRTTTPSIPSASAFGNSFLAYALIFGLLNYRFFSTFAISSAYFFLRLRFYFGSFLAKNFISCQRTFGKNKELTFINQHLFLQFN